MIIFATFTTSLRKNMALQKSPINSQRNTKFGQNIQVSMCFLFKYVGRCIEDCQIKVKLCEKTSKNCGLEGVG